VICYGPRGSRHSGAQLLLFRLTLWFVEFGGRLPLVLTMTIVALLPVGFVAAPQHIEGYNHLLDSASFLLTFCLYTVDSALVLLLAFRAATFRGPAVTGRRTSSMGLALWASRVNAK